jgi:putative FmdB family regulatory protein
MAHYWQSPGSSASPVTRPRTRQMQHQGVTAVPTYQYACTNPGGKHEFERVQSFTDAPVSECPECGVPVRKVYGSVGVVFKGSGFYRTDSRKAATASEGSSSNGSSSNGSSSSSKESAAAPSSSPAPASTSGSSGSKAAN